MACLDEDVVIEILIHLPLKPLLKIRTVCKSWREIIDSTHFKQSHIDKHANNYNDNYEDDDTQVVVHRIKNYPDSVICSLCQIRNLPEICRYIQEPDGLVTASDRIVTGTYRAAKVAGPVNGLLCIYSISPNGDITIYNPGLDQIKKLPVHKYSTCRFRHSQHVVLGYDNIVHNYKVVQLLSGSLEGCVHAAIYSKTTNYWRVLKNESLPRESLIFIKESINSSCTDGTAGHWLAKQGVGDDSKNIIISFDMKSEVFRILEMPDFGSVSAARATKKICAKRETFVLFAYSIERGETSSRSFNIYEARIEKNILHWNPVAKLDALFAVVLPQSLWTNDCVVLYHHYHSKHEVIFYEYYQNKIVSRFPVSARAESRIFRYKGSFITP